MTKATLSDRTKLAILLHASGVEPNHIPALIVAAANASSQIELKIDVPPLVASLIQRVEIGANGIKLQLRVASENGADAIITNDMPMQIKRRGVEMHLVIGNTKGNPDSVLIKAVARAHIWFEELVTGKISSVADIAKREKLDGSYISRLLNLAFLPPKIVDSILAGNQPADWTVNVLIKNAEQAAVWSDH